MSFNEKIDEWIKEAETRPGSALLILKLIGGRLRDLTGLNEELRSENIALQDGSRVLEYQKRITYLEFQLDLLKRRLGTLAENEIPAGQVSILNLLIYNAAGRTVRLKPEESDLANGSRLGQIIGDMTFKGELPRIMAVDESEEVMLLFTSGRISTQPVSGIPASEIYSTWKWDDAHLPDEPHAGEELACIMKLAQLPVADAFIQVSRRGCVKKTLKSISDQVLSTHYLGRGTNLKNDLPFDVSLAEKKGRLLVITYEGRLLSLETNDLSYSAEERIKLTPSDHIVGSFMLGQGESLLCLTQNGKILQRETDSLEFSRSPSARGQALISPSRLEQGTRFVGAAPFTAADSLAVMDGQENILVYKAGDVCGSGTMQVAGEKEKVFVSLGRIPGSIKQGSRK